MHTITNPILAGFHPDPSIVKVGEDYYLATSTFEWYPGVCIYHSRDLVNWQLVAQPLNQLDMLDMRGNPDSCGIWAPCLSVRDGMFYLCFTNVRRFAGDCKDTPNYYTTATSIRGPWSAPVYVNSSGFDPSLFHDEDGRSYWLNMVWDHRPARGRNNFLPNKYFAGIQCQQIDLDSGKLVGEVKTIYPGSDIGLSEGPHIYKRGEYYYLLVAEGGTGKDHACTVARAESVWGPYETDPQGPLLTSADAPGSAIKRAGHGDFADGPDGQTILVHLCSRPLPYRGRSVMGRETALQYVSWNEQGWPRLADGGHTPAAEFDSAVPKEVELQRETVHFAAQTALPGSYQSLRYPLPADIADCESRPGYLRLHGQESLGSWFEQSLLARRQQAFCFDYQVCLEFEPANFQQMAGLVCYYSSQKYIYLHVTHDEQRGRVLDVSMCAASWHAQYPMAEPISLPENGEITLRARVNYDVLELEYRLPEGEWQPLNMRLDYSILSDEMGDGGADANFTGAFVGFACQDLTGARQHADIRWVNYEEMT